ncbi:hypothetical protein VNO77_32002 [Canavalia gladiata]|uniref:Exocyst subunit Exo70 family protein n=1 Tax=Canavalia gladiata TaxID=3824 RepID=A0AAN9Q802_CANGL
MLFDKSSHRIAKNDSVLMLTYRMSLTQVLAQMDNQAHKLPSQVDWGRKVCNMDGCQKKISLCSKCSCYRKILYFFLHFLEIYNEKGRVSLYSGVNKVVHEYKPNSSHLIMPIRILKWLMQPKVWRFVCFTSSVVGLFFYALSSSFNHLFGKWNLWKILIYSTFSFIICLAILFAKVWQRSPSLRFKAHMAFLVLIITSVYSFFFDRVVNGKPDSYSLISCAAFAIMSLSLSRQTHCGIEVDLLYFFSGCLIIQLMKIKLLLVVVGACFSYTLIILRCYLDASEESDRFRVLVQDQVVIQIDSHSQETNTDNAIQVDSSHANTTDHHFTTELNTDTELNTNAYTINARSKQRNSDSVFLLPQLMRCIEALKKENRNLIRMVSKHVDEYLKAKIDSEDEDRISMPQLHPDDNLVIDALPSDIVNNLHETAKLMAEAGFEKKCCHVYSRCRREFLKEWFSRFRLQELNMEDVDKMEKIEKWIKALNVAVRILFPNEKKLCDRVFFGLSSAADMSFINVCTKLTIPLLSFIDTLAIERHSLDLLSSITPKVFETLRDLIPEFDSLFSDLYSAPLRHVRSFWGILPLKIEFNNFISCGMAQAIVPDGRIPPITIEAMDRISKLVQNLSMPEIESPLLSIQVASLIDMLVRNLEGRFENYTDPALGYVFITNNLWCIQQMAKKYPLKNSLGDDWFRKNIVKVQQSLELYRTSSWNKVVEFLKLDSNDTFLKDKLSLFNLHFEEMCNIQSTWYVFDMHIREQIIISLENILLPAYGNFIQRMRDVLGKQGDKYIQYGIFNIQDRLNHLFLVSEPVNQLHEIWRENNI